MRIRTTALVMSALVFASVSVARASLLEPISIQRYVQASSWAGGSYNDSKNGVGVTPFSAQAYTPGAISRQTSSITATSVAVSGFASGCDDETTGTVGMSRSYFREEFIVFDDSEYSITLDWDITGYGCINSSVNVSLEGWNVYDWEGTVFETIREGYGLGGSGTWAGSGIIYPGIYTLIIEGTGKTWWGGDLWAHTTFDANFTLTPEPTCAAMFGVAVLFVARRAKGRRA